LVSNTFSRATGLAATSAAAPTTILSAGAVTMATSQSWPARAADSASSIGLPMPGTARLAAIATKNSTSATRNSSAPHRRVISHNPARSSRERRQMRNRIQLRRTKPRIARLSVMTWISAGHKSSSRAYFHALNRTTDRTPSSASRFSSRLRNVVLPDPHAP
jgi:hypothetical protein